MLVSKHNWYFNMNIARYTYNYIYIKSIFKLCILLMIND